MDGPADKDDDDVDCQAGEGDDVDAPGTPGYASKWVSSAGGSGLGQNGSGL